jgi:hypothetical protein
MPSYGLVRRDRKRFLSMPSPRIFDSSVERATPSRAAALVLYDGNPLVNEGRILWDYAEQEHVTHFGTSAKYLDALAKMGANPKAMVHLEALRVFLSTAAL